MSPGISIGIGIGAGLGARAGSGFGYLFRDLFITPRAAGEVHGSAAEPGVTTRGATDLDSRITIADGLVKIAAGGSTGDRTAFWEEKTITRVAGQVVAFDYLSPSGGGNTIQFGLGNAKAASLNNHINIGLRSLGSVSLLARSGTAASSPKIAVTAATNTYRIYQVLRAVGSFYFIKTGSTVKFLWADDWDATPDLYFSVVANGVLASHYGAIVAPVPRYTFDASSSDSFNRGDGAAGDTDGFGHAEGGSGDGLTWVEDVGNVTIASNALVLSTLSGGVGISTVDTGNTDEFISVEATRAGGNIGVVTRYVDTNNYIRIYHDGTAFKLDKVVGGSVTNVGSFTTSPVSGASIRIRCDGTNIWGYYNDLDANMEPLTISDAILQTGTKHGVYSTNVGNTFDNWFTIPVNGYADLGEI